MPAGREGQTWTFGLEFDVQTRVRKDAVACLRACLNSGANHNNDNNNNNNNNDSTTATTTTTNNNNDNHNDNHDTNTNNHTRLIAITNHTDTNKLTVGFRNPRLAFCCA